MDSATKEVSFEISFFQGHRGYEARVEPYNGISQTSFPGLCSIAAYRVAVYLLDKNAEIHVFYFGEHQGDPLFWLERYQPDKQERAKKIAEKLNKWGGGDTGDDDPSCLKSFSALTHLQIEKDIA